VDGAHGSRDSFGFLLAVGCKSCVDGAHGSCVDGAHGSRDSFGFLLAVGCKSCVRPVCAALIAAGHDVIRRSSPYH
jgi:hypothetical protein